MATNRIEEYLEAILAKIADGTDTTVPAPAWRIEEYLAAIYSALSNGGGGTGGGVLVVHETVSVSTHTLDKTFKEIKDAGFSVLYTEEDGVYYVYGMTRIDYSNYSVSYGSDEYTATSEDGYPSCEQGH